MCHPCSKKSLAGRGGLASAWLLAASVALLGAGVWLHSAFAAEQPAGQSADERDAPPKPGPDGDTKRVGHLLRLKLPISGETYSRARRFVRKALDKAQADGYRPVLIFEFVVRPDQSEFGRGSEFGASTDLARFLTSKEVAGAQTVAYVPSSIQGHAVLVVLACDDIVMAPDAEIGSAGIDEQVIEPDMRSTYRVIADRRRNFPADVALALLDPALEVLEVKTDLGTEYVSPERLKKLREEDRTIIGEPKVLVPAGQPGQFTGNEARRLRFIANLASDVSTLARRLDLPPEAVKEDVALSEKWRAVGVQIRGPIDHDKARRTQKLIEDAVHDRGANLVVLRIQSPGGRPADSIQLANFLGLELRAKNVHTVAYVPEEARADAALIALACGQLVMHPEAKLGGPGAYEMGREEIDAAVETVRNKEGAWRHRSWSLVAAMIDPDLEVFRYTREGDAEFFCARELEEVERAAPPAKKWVRGERLLTRRGVRGDEARDYRLADLVVRDFAEFQKEFSLEDDLALVEPGWAQFLIDVLARPEVAGILLAIGFFALYFELHTPGLGIGGFVATVCFLLFFWARFLGGTAGWLEAILFVAGVACLLLEIFVIPGFGIFGLGGGLLIIASLVLASQTFIIPRNEYQVQQSIQSLMVLTGATLGVVVMAWGARRWLPRAPVLSRMFLEPPEGEEAETIRQREALADYQGLVGARGVTATQLTPSGKARFGNRLVDVIADGELIERGRPVVVTEVQGYRVLVRAAEEA